MLVDSRAEREPSGHQTRVFNKEQKVVASGSQKFFWYVLVIITFGLIYIRSVKVANWFKKQQIRINEVAGNIDVNLAKRRDLLVKLLEQTKGYIKHEQTTFALVAKYRGNNASKGEIQQLDGSLSKMFSDINIAYEQYPNLKADGVVRELMGSTQYLETEIAAARRLYNSEVGLFNAEIFLYPVKLITAAKMGLSTMALFAASTEQIKDVDMSSISSELNTN